MGAASTGTTRSRLSLPPPPVSTCRWQCQLRHLAAGTALHGVSPPPPSNEPPTCLPCCLVVSQVYVYEGADPDYANFLQTLHCMVCGGDGNEEHLLICDGEGGCVGVRGGGRKKRGGGQRGVFCHLLVSIDAESDTPECPTARL